MLTRTHTLICTVSTCVHLLTHTHTHAHTQTLTHTQIHFCTLRLTCVHTLTHTHTCPHPLRLVSHMHTDTLTRVFICTLTPTHSYAHVHTPSDTLTLTFAPTARNTPLYPHTLTRTHALSHTQAPAAASWLLYKHFLCGILYLDPILHLDVAVLPPPGRLPAPAPQLHVLAVLCMSKPVTGGRCGGPYTAALTLCCDHCLPQRVLEGCPGPSPIQ